MAGEGGPEGAFAETGQTASPNDNMLRPAMAPMKPLLPQVPSRPLFVSFGLMLWEAMDRTKHDEAGEDERSAEESSR